MTRTSGCPVTTAWTVLTRKKVPVGAVYYTITHQFRSSPKSRTYTESVALQTTRVVGAGAGVRIRLAPSCSGTCRVSGSVSGIVGGTLRATFTYRDATAGVHTNQTRYHLRGSKPGYRSSGGVRWNSVLKVRCDNQLARQQAAGCVMPQHTPTLTSLSSLRFVAPNIRTLQSRGAPKTLHRNSALTAANRKAVCGPARLPAGWTPPPGWPLPLTDKRNKPSCDEYAFAGTAEGGKRRGNGYGWVPKGENDAQGGRLNAFYLENRVLNPSKGQRAGDAFHVKV
ncbi:NucA/NucB deoxyribonuclease domain-containing protein [Spirillospora sp. NPDC050679]